jgi:hypothetical protein
MVVFGGRVEENWTIGKTVPASISVFRHLKEPQHNICGSSGG